MPSVIPAALRALPSDSRTDIEIVDDVAATSNTPPRLQLRGLRKYFAASGVLAVDDVSLDIAAGEVVALIGENGTGKTTLMNLLFGVHAADAGDILIDGEVVSIRGQQDALAHGVGMVHQHFELVPSFTVAQNVLLGREPHRRGLYDDTEAQRKVGALAAQVGLEIDPSRRVASLPVGTQQRVEILKALAADARVLILDEPTAVLTPAETDELLTLLRVLASTGRSIIFISHKLPEVQTVADRIVVMRRGRIVGDFSKGSVTAGQLATLMVGRDVQLNTRRHGDRTGSALLEIRAIAAPPTVDGSTGLHKVTFTLRAGEIIGVAGVSGNGQDELVEGIAGLRPFESGTVQLAGTELTGASPAAIRRAGLAHIAADRIHVGLNLQGTLEENAVSTSYRSSRFSRFGLIRRTARRRFAEMLIADYQVRGGHPTRTVGSLSGGNLQKIVIGRELAGSPLVVLANQPTQGLDVGSIEFVHAALSAVRAQGSGVLLVSSELEEILALSDRVVVMYHGVMLGPYNRTEIGRERLGRILAEGKDGE
jgi:ABC-type uncharacterized transport system ATPase subunit